MTTEVLLITLVFFFAINTPIAVAIGIASIVGILVQGDLNMMMVVQRMFGGTDSFHLMAVPLFMFTGTIMEALGSLPAGRLGDIDAAATIPDTANRMEAGTARPTVASTSQPLGSSTLGFGVWWTCRGTTINRAINE